MELVGRAPVMELSPRRGREILKYSSFPFASWTQNHQILLTENVQFWTMFIKNLWTQLSLATEISQTSRFEIRKPKCVKNTGISFRIPILVQIFNIFQIFWCHSPNSSLTLKTKFSRGDYDIALRERSISSLQAKFWRQFSTKPLLQRNYSS